MTTSTSNSTQPDTNSNTSPYMYTYTIRPAIHSDLPHLPAIESSAASLFTSIPALSHLANDKPMNYQAHLESLEKWNDRSEELGGQEGGTWIVVAREIAGGAEEGKCEREEDGEDGEEEGSEIVGFVVTELLIVTHELDETFYTQTMLGVPEPYFIHINELSIHASHQRRGLAMKLLNTVKDFALSISTDSLSRTDNGNGNAKDDADGLRILGLSLTTFRDVPFNAPFYEKFGFWSIEDGDVERVVGIEGEKIWREDRGRFEGQDGGGKGLKRCWMVCWL